MGRMGMTRVSSSGAGTAGGGGGGVGAGSQQQGAEQSSRAQADDSGDALCDRLESEAGTGCSDRTGMCSVGRAVACSSSASGSSVAGT